MPAHIVLISNALPVWISMMLACAVSNPCVVDDQERNEMTVLIGPRPYHFDSEAKDQLMSARFMVSVGEHLSRKDLRHLMGASKWHYRTLQHLTSSRFESLSSEIVTLIGEWLLHKDLHSLITSSRVRYYHRALRANANYRFLNQRLFLAQKFRFLLKHRAYNIDIERLLQIPVTSPVRWKHWQDAHQYVLQHSGTSSFIGFDEENNASFIEFALKPLSSFGCRDILHATQRHTYFYVGIRYRYMRMYQHSV